MSDFPVSFIVSTNDAGKRLDQFLKERVQDVSRSQIQKWIHSGTVKCGSEPAHQAYKLRAGDSITVAEPEDTLRVVPEDLPLDILHEDAAILVVNKPAGIVTHPGIGHRTGTLANAAAHHLQKRARKPIAKLFRWSSDDLERGSGLRPGIVHRLDKDTSGVLVIAKTPRFLDLLSQQFHDRTVMKVYRAIVVGEVEARRGEVQGSIGKGYHTPRMAITATGRASRTDFKVLKSFSGSTYLEVVPHTGRTHQIRVHLAQIGHPVLGDSMYGKPTPGVPRQMLHAYQLTITHPVSKKKLTFIAPLPTDFQSVLKRL